MRGCIKYECPVVYSVDGMWCGVYLSQDMIIMGGHTNTASHHTVAPLNTAPHHLDIFNTLH